MFLRFFPHFTPASIFSNKDWRNQLAGFKADTRETIDKAIRTDEGIGVLRRFNVHFSRTF